MEFRPCIDIHDGCVKQIVGGSLSDNSDETKENFVSDVDAAFYAKMYRERGIRGGHVILLNGANSPLYEETRKQAISTLNAYPGGLQIGGGITLNNATEYIDAGASHVIVTSFVFKDGYINMEALSSMVALVGKEHLVLDLSVRKTDDKYMIVTDRWQKFTDTELNLNTLNDLSKYCDEYLIHAVDVEGKASGIEEELAATLGAFDKIPVTYAGGVHSFDDLEIIKILGKNHVNVTVGSALDIFGGSMKFDEVVDFCKRQ